MVNKSPRGAPDRHAHQTQLSRYYLSINFTTRILPKAHLIKPQARTLAEDRGIECLVLDYDDMRGIEPTNPQLF